MRRERAFMYYHWPIFHRAVFLLIVQQWGNGGGAVTTLNMITKINELGVHRRSIARGYNIVAWWLLWLMCVCVCVGDDCLAPDLADAHCMQLN